MPFRVLLYRSQRPGAAGIEPAVPVLETGGLPLTDAPNLKTDPSTAPGGLGMTASPSLCFLVQGVGPTEPTILLQLQPLCLRRFVLKAGIIPAATSRAL